MIKINDLRKKTLAALLLAFMALSMLGACSTTEEQWPDDAMINEICVDADADMTDCPRERLGLSLATIET